MQESEEVIDEVDLVYRTCSRFDSSFYERIATALANDLEREREASDDEENMDASALEDGEDADSCYFPNDEEASDAEQDQEFEVQEEFQSDDENEEEVEEENDELIQAESHQFFFAKDGTKWSKIPPQTGRLRAHNVIRSKGGPIQNIAVPIEVFKKMFTPNIIFIIIKETNRNAADSINKWNTKNPNKKRKIWVELTEVELNAFIGLLLAAGVNRSNMQHASVLWKPTNLPIFRATMAYTRFMSILRYIRFDDSRTRPFRTQTDKAAAISDIWNMLNENLQKNYQPHENITIDEQLFPYRGRTKFTQYIPSKPARYGIKVWWACDAKTHYPLHGNIYTGKNPSGERATNQGENEMMRLASKYSKSGRTIVADNFFSSLEGCKRLMSIGLGFVGTLRSNKRYIPPEMKKHPSRPVLSSEFGFYDKEIAMCSYVPKKIKP